MIRSQGRQFCDRAGRATRAIHPRASRMEQLVIATARTGLGNRSTRLSCALSLALLLGAGCSDERVYIGDGGRYHVELTASATPTFMGAEGGAIYIVETRVQLPVRAPSAAVLSDLTQSATRYPGLPFPRLPWVERRALPIEVDFALENQDDAVHDITVIVNGWNEFHEYQPGVVVVDEEPTPDYAQWEWSYKLAAHQRVTRTIREESFDEVAVDLATVVNHAPNSNQVVFFENKSDTDVRNRPFIPPVIPGLIGFRIGLRATAASAAVLDASVRVRDAGDRLAGSGEAVLEAAPQIFMPITPES